MLIHSKLKGMSHLQRKKTILEFQALTEQVMKSFLFLIQLDHNLNNVTSIDPHVYYKILTMLLK